MRTKDSRNFFGIFLFFVVVVVAVLGFNAWFFYNRLIGPMTNEDKAISVLIEPGFTRTEVAETLEELGIVSKSQVLNYARIFSAGGDLKAGEHLINSNMTLAEVFETLAQAPLEETVWVTIPEGLRHDEIAETLAVEFAKVEDSKFNQTAYINIATNPFETKFFDMYPDNPAVELVKNSGLEAKKEPVLEGFLFPNTFNFKTDATAEEVILKQIETLYELLETEGLLTVLESSDYNLYEILNIAAMIEREAFTDEEAYMISGIIHNRLDAEMALGIDATYLYELKDWKAVITQRIIDTDTLYNTRTRVGLPFTPIANPGIVTIDAALNPKANDFLFYLHGSDGKIYYGKTNAEHEANKRYL